MTNPRQDVLSLIGDLSAKRSLLAAAACCALAFANASPSRAQTLVVKTKVNGQPKAVAFNPNTKKLYVLSALSLTDQSGTITVMDATTGGVITTLPFGARPNAIAINPVTNKIYATGYSLNLTPPNFEVGNLTVIDGATDTITSSVPVGLSPGSLAVNSITNKIYEGDGAGTLTVIDGSTDTVAATLSLGLGVSVLINPITNKIYASSYNDGSVSIIDGATNTVTAKVTVPSGAPGAISAAINTVTNKVYVATSNASLAVIDGTTDTLETAIAIASGTGLLIEAVAFNTATNKIYAAVSNGNVAIIDGSTESVTALVPEGNDPVSIAVDALANKIYIANIGNPEAANPATDTTGSVAVLDGATNLVTTVQEGTEPDAVILDPTDNRIYVANFGSSDVAILDGATNATATVTAGSDPFAVAVDPVLNKAYIANDGSNDVTVIDGATNATTYVPAGTNPFAVAVDPVTGKAFVANQGSNTVTEIDGATYAATTIPVGTAPQAVAINSVTGTVYVANSRSSSVTVINEATNATATVATGSTPMALAVNPATNRIYVANEGGNDVTVINGATNTTSSIPVGSSPDAVDVNPTTNKIYVADRDGYDVTVIDGATGTTSHIPVGTMPVAVSVNPVTNKIYVADQDSDNVTVIDGSNNAASPIAVGFLPQAIAIDMARNKVYVANGGSDDLTVIDGATNSTSTLPGGNGPASVAANPITGKVFVADIGDEATAVTGQATQPMPLATQISPFPGNVTTSPRPTFTFTTSDSFAPTAPPVLDVFYEVDTLQGPWLAASGPGPTFTGQTQSLTIGVHILYAYARDTQPDFSNWVGKGVQEVVGSISAYFFMVVPTATQTTLTSDKNPSQVGDTVNLTAVVAPAPPGTGTPTGAVDFFDGTALLGSAALDSNGHATYTTSALAAGTHQMTARYDGDSTFASSTSAAFTQTVNENFTVTANPSTLTITHGRSGSSTVTVSPVGGADTLAISFSCTGLPAGSTCTFSPGTVTPGANPVTATMTIQTAGSALVSPPLGVPAPPPGLLLLFAFAAALGVGTSLLDARRTRMRWVPATCLLASLMLVALAIGCGGGNASSSPPPTFAPTGNFTVTVHATGGFVDQTTNIALTVN